MPPFPHSCYVALIPLVLPETRSDSGTDLFNFDSQGSNAQIITIDYNEASQPRLVVTGDKPQPGDLTEQMEVMLVSIEEGEAGGGFETFPAGWKLLGVASIDTELRAVLIPA